MNPQFVFNAEVGEWINSAAPPYFEGITEEAIASLGTSEEDEVAVQEMLARHRQASARYSVREDNGKLIKSQAEVYRCRKKGILIAEISYPEALALLTAEDQARNERYEKKQKRKAKRRR